MQITPLEALDIINYLNTENRITAELIFHLQETITQYRLQHFIGTGKKNIRKTYTCPFFENALKGCTISRNSKPIGCLGFNPIEINFSNGGTCKSNILLLNERDAIFHENESEINSQLIKELKLFWDKAPIPLAVFEMLTALEN